MKRTLAFLAAIAMAGCGGTKNPPLEGSDGGGGGGNWRAGNRGALLASADGQNYTIRASATDADLLSIFCVNRTYGWAVGTGGHFMRTTDAGRTWTQVA